MAPSKIRLSALLLLVSLFSTPVFAADASLSPIPSGDALIGEQGCLKTVLSNTGSPGYGPYFNVTLSERITLDSVSIIGIDLPFSLIGVIDGITPVFDPVSGAEIVATPIANVYQVIPPIGSVVENGPTLEFEICGTLQTTLNAGELQEISVTPGYIFGDTPTGSNGPIYDPADQKTGTINPVILKLEKSDTAPESERPPGPSFPYDYHLSANVAAGAVIDNVQLVDIVDPALQWTGAPIQVIAPAGANCTLDTSPDLPPVSGGTIAVSCDSVTGSPADVDLEVIYTVYITDILDETATSPQQVIDNQVVLNYDYLGDSFADIAIDPVTAKPLPLQKTAAPGQVLPGDDVTYSLNFQYTDYPDPTGAEIEKYTLTDVLPDGLAYNTGSANLTLAGVDLGGITPVITPGPNLGETTLVFSVVNLQSFVNGKVGSVIFTAKAAGNYADGSPVLARDTLTNTAKSEWELRNGGSGSDSSSADIQVFPATFTKNIVDPSPLPPFLKPGDAVIFSLSQFIPPGKIGNLVLTDHLPLPVFDVSTFDTVTDWVLLTPAPGLVPPVVSKDVATNSIKFDFGTIEQALNLTIAVELRVTIVDTPFADDLSLVNIAQAEYLNSNGDAATLVDVEHITVAAPALDLHKGVLSADNPGANIAPAPGDPTAAPVDGDVSGVDGSDILEFMLTVENTGNAPAYQVIIKDPAISGLNCTLPAADDVKNGNGDLLAFTALGADWDAGIQLSDPLAATDGTPGGAFSTDTALIIVRCGIDPLVQFSQVITNTATATWAATDSATTFFPELSETAKITITSPKISKSISDITPGYTSNPPFGNNAQRGVSVGERVSWKVEVTLPEGSMNNVNFQDLLDNGLAFVDNSLLITPSSGNVISSIGFPAAIANADYLDAGALPPGEDRRLAIGPSLNAPGLGNISNTDNDNTTAETLVFEYQTIVLNWSSNNHGVKRNNRADVSWDNSTGGRARARARGPNVTIHEPGVQINKTLSASSGDAGDAITVNIDITHPNPGDAPGFQLELRDQLPADMVFAGNLALGTCANTPDTPLAEAGGVISATWNSFPVGAGCSLSFDVTIANSVNPGEVIQNCANILWQSLDDPDQVYPLGQNPLAVERTGLTGDPGGSANIYAGQDCANFNVISVGLEKTITSTSQAHTGTNQHQPTVTDLTIGEEISYQIVATLPEGVIPQLIISDTVPFGESVLELLSATVTSVGSNITLPGAIPAAVITDSLLGDGINDTALFDFGQDIDVAPDQAPQDDKDRVFITVTARVRDLPVNLDADKATNNALVQFGPGLSGGASAAAELVEPQLSIHKTVDNTTADAGDPLIYTLQIEHAPTSTADAFFVNIEDALPAGLNFVGSLALGTCNLPPTSGPSENAGIITVNWDSFPLGSNCEISFKATPVIAVNPGQQITNKATANWVSLDTPNLPDNRPYTDEAQVTVVISKPGLIKDIFSTDNIDTSAAEKGPADDLTIGETVAYRVVVTFEDGTVPRVLVKDTLPGNTTVLEYVSSEVISIGADLSFSNPLAVGDPGDACLPNCDANGDGFRDLAVWDLASVVNLPDAIAGPNPDDVLVLEVTAIVADTAQNSGAPGTDENQTNLAEVFTLREIFSSLHNIDIVEPFLGITKTALPANGQVVDGSTPDLVYELIISHEGSSTADAYELTISDPLNPETFWVDDSLVTSDCPNFSIVASPTAGQSGTVEFAIGQLPKTVTQCSIQYTVDINDLLPVKGVFPNTAVLTWNSMPLPAIGREGTDHGTGVIISTPDAQIVKSAISTDVPETGKGTGTDIGDDSLFDLTIGEQVVYDLIMTFNEGTTQDVNLNDMIQDDAGGRMEIIAASVTAIGADITTTLPGTVVGPLPGNTLMMDFGNVANGADVQGRQNDTITVRVVARMIDSPENIDDNNVLNTGALNFQAELDRVDTEQVNTVLPVLQMTKTMGPLVDNVIEIVLQLENTGTAPAYDLVITDPFDETLYTALSAAEVLTPAGFAFSQASSTGTTTVKFELQGDPLMPSADQILMPGESMELRFEIEALGGDQPASTSLDNIASTDYTSLPGPSPNEGNYNTTAAANLKLPSMELIKDWSGPNNPAHPGDTITFTITVNNTGEADATDVLITDTPDSLGDFNAGSVTSTASGIVQKGNTPGDTSIEVLVPVIAAGGNAVIAYTVGIANPWPIEPQVLVNQATVDSHELTPGVTDWPVDPGTQDPTIVDIVADPVLTLSKTDNGVTAFPGQALVYTLGYANTGNQDTAGVVITETVPLYTTFSSAASLPTVWSCADGAAAGSSCETTIGLLDAGSSGTVLFGLTVDDPIPAGVDRIDNSASITDDGKQSDDGQPVTATASDNTPINGLPGLLVSKDDGGISVVPTQVYAYTIEYENTGEQDLTGVKLTESVPPYTFFIAAASTAGWSCADGSPAGTVCELDIGALDAGTTGSVNFGLQVITPLPSQVDMTLNTVTINDDGSSTEAGVISDQDQDTTPIIAVPDLSILKDDGGIPNAQPGSVINYNLNWALAGNQNTENVIVTETVPVGATYSAADSLPDVWSCTNGAPAGTTCQLNLGAVTVGASGLLSFAVLIDNPLPPGVNEAVNTASISDGGINGADPTPENNISTVVTPLILEPPAGRKSGRFDPGSKVVVWEMIWFNPNNTSDLPVLILDELPRGASFVSVDCLPTGNSSCSAVYNQTLGRIEVTGIIGPDFGAADDAPEDQLNNEIKIVLLTDSVQAGNSQFTNHAQGCWDYNNSGSAEDDYLDGQECIPVEASVGISIPIPLFDHWARLLSMLLLLLSGLFVLRLR